MNADEGRPAWAARIRGERKTRRWSAEELARRLRDAADPRIRAHLPSLDNLVTYIRRWERGANGVSERYRMLYARAFDMSDEELFGTARDDSADAVLPAGHDSNGVISPDDEERLFAAATAPSRLDLRVVDSLAVILGQQRRTEDIFGSAPLLEPVAGQLTTIQRLVVEARGPLRSKIVHVAGEWAQFYGWLQANTGNLAQGNAWLDRALEWAVETGDVDLISEVVSFKGHVAWMGERIGGVIGLSAAALHGDGLYPGQYAISAAQQARGHAMAGDAYDAERLLDDADCKAAEARNRQDEAPPWLYYHSPGFFALQRGLTYRYLGRHDHAYNQRAIDTLTDGLAELPADMRDSEWAGEFVYQLGRAFLQAGEREGAAALAGALDTLARQIGSQRLAGQASALH